MPVLWFPAYAGNHRVRDGKGCRRDSSFVKAA